MTIRGDFAGFTTRAVTAGVCVLSVLLTFGCAGRDESPGAVSGDTSPVVARVEDSSITSSDLKSYLSSTPLSERRPISKDDLDQVLDERVIEEVLYREALRQGLDRDPEVRREIRQTVIGRFIREYMNREVWSKEIGEAELQEYYDQHESEFNRPEQVRVADIFIAVPREATVEEKAAARGKAETVLAEALEASGTRSGFGLLIGTYSDTPEGYAKGDTGFFNDKGMPGGVAAELVEAAFALQRVGSVATQVVEAADGYHVIMLTGRRSAVHLPLEKVRDKLTQRMRREAAHEARRALIDGLRTKAEVEVDDEVLAGLLKDVNLGVPEGEAVSGKEGTLPAGKGDLSPPALPEGR